MIFKKSITAKFLAALFVILLVGQSLGTAIFIFYGRAALYDSLEKRIQRSASILAGVSAGPLQNYDYTLIDTYLQEVMKDEDITSVRVLDAAGNPIKEAAKTTAAEQSADTPFFSGKRTPLRRLIIRYSQWRKKCV